MDLSTFIKSTRNLTGELEGLVVRYDPSPYKLGQIPPEDQHPFSAPGHAFEFMHLDMEVTWISVPSMFVSNQRVVLNPAPSEVFLDVQVGSRFIDRGDSHPSACTESDGPA